MTKTPVAPAGSTTTFAAHTALFLSVALLVAGNGLQGTLLGVRGGLEGMSRLSIGLFMSAYFLGYLAGVLMIPGMVYKVGHIRTFAGLTSIVSTISLAHVLSVSTVSWIALRAVHGFCYAGLVLVIESWLNGSTGRSQRGRVLAVYGSIVLMALAAGQLLLNAAPPTSFVPFCLVSILLSLALVPVTMSNVTTPGVVEAQRMSLRQVYSVSPIGVVSVFVVGMTYSAFVGLGPSYALERGLPTSGISLFMSSALVGALLLQWPIGILSDRIDRRWVILLCTTAVIAVSVLIASDLVVSTGAVVGLVGLFGAVSIPIYSVSMANAIDWIEERDVIPATSALLIVFGVGSILGPLASGLVMARVGPGGLFYMIGVVNLMLLLYGINRLIRRRARAARQEAFVALPRTTPALLQLDERASGVEE